MNDALITRNSRLATLLRTGIVAAMLAIGAGWLQWNWQTGVIAAQYVRSWRLQPEDEVLLAAEHVADLHEFVIDNVGTSDERHFADLGIEYYKYIA